MITSPSFAQSDTYAPTKNGVLEGFNFRRGENKGERDLSVYTTSKDLSLDPVIFLKGISKKLANSKAHILGAIEKQIYEMTLDPRIDPDYYDEDFIGDDFITGAHGDSLASLGPLGMAELIRIEFLYKDRLKGFKDNKDGVYGGSKFVNGLRSTQIDSMEELEGLFDKISKLKDPYLSLIHI